jgi:sterol desaturase/sphingolipid hydroxylase (fatty acid hydroxylase superfamily)
MRWLVYAITAVATACVGSFLQASLHLLLGHNRVGGVLFRNHVRYHHCDYSDPVFTTSKYINERASNTPYYLVPAGLVTLIAYVLLPFDLFIVVGATMLITFAALTHFHVQYHLNHSWLDRFGWFRRNRLLHLEHHRDMGKNFAVAGAVWDRMFGTYAPPRNSTWR